MAQNLLVKGVATPRWISLDKLDPDKANLTQLRTLLVSKSIMAAKDLFVVDGTAVDEVDLAGWSITSATKPEGAGKRSVEVKPSASPSNGTTEPVDSTAPDESEDGATPANDDDSPTAEDAVDPDDTSTGSGGRPLARTDRPTPPSIELPSEADETLRLQYYSDLTKPKKRWVFRKVGLYRGLRFLLGSDTLASPGTDILVVPRSGKSWPNAVPTSPTLAISMKLAFTWTYHSLQKDVSHSASLGGSYKMVGLSMKYQRDESHLEIHEKTKIYMYGEYLLPKISLVLEKDDLVMPPPVVAKFKRILDRPMQAKRYAELASLLNDELGAYVPLEVIVGGRLWSERTREVTNNDDLARKVDEFGAKLSVKAKVFSVNAGYNYRNEENKTKSDSTATEDVSLQLVGGDPAKFPEPPKWIGSLGPYKSWAAVKYARLEPTITFLPVDLRNKLLEVFDRFAPYDPGDQLVDYRAYIREYMIPEDDDLR